MIKLIYSKNSQNINSNHLQQLTMTDFEYRNSSITSLVQELNILGNKSVLLQQTQLIAIQNPSNKYIRRFQSKSLPQKNFFICPQNDKKYFYTHVHQKIHSQLFTDPMRNWKNGYNCTILLQNNLQTILNLIKAIEQWLQGSLIFCIALNSQNQLLDLFGQVKITHRQLLENKKYYEIEDSEKVQLLAEYLQRIHLSSAHDFDQSLIDITFKNVESCSELHLTLLPSSMLSSECNPPFSLIKTQLIQVLNYIKINPNKRYEHISKLITKRLPMTNYLTRILMSDSYNLIMNQIKSEQGQKNDSIGKFEFYDKLSIIGNLLRKADRHIVQLGVIRPLPIGLKNQNIDSPNPLTIIRAQQQNQKYSKSIKQEIVSPIGRLNLKTQNEDFQIPDQQEPLQQKQFHFCRSLQRKTHKFSISPRQQNTQNLSKSQLQTKHILTSQVENFLDKKTMNKYVDFSYKVESNKMQLSKGAPQRTLFKGQQWTQNGRNAKNNISISESEQIVLLKAEHTRQISQYHQTIQLLNKKIIVLAKQNNLEELYKIHEREIMLLELKIKELRQDILILTSDEPNQKSIKSLVKKLTQEIKSYETSSTAKKLSQAKVHMLEKELNEANSRLSKSQKVRATLSLQVETLTKRLKIRDSQIEKINQEDIEKYQQEELSVTEEHILQEIKKLVGAVKEQERNSDKFLTRKISLILSDLSKYRDIILECNDFLVQLMEILDFKLSNKAPQIVLDCNKFIRQFLMENLSIF